MASYTLTEEFQLLNETSGVIVNSSDVKAELCTSPVHGTGVILHPHKKINFNNILYAARAPSDEGVAVIGVLEGGSSGDPIILMQDDEVITYADVASLFGVTPPAWGQETILADEEITDDDINSMF